jgi:hypothetical protein
LDEEAAPPGGGGFRAILSQHAVLLFGTADPSRHPGLQPCGKLREYECRAGWAGRGRSDRHRLFVMSA